MEKYSSSNQRGLKSFIVLGILLFLIGAASLIFSVIDLFHGKPSVAHYDQSLGGLQIENPLWPSSGIYRSVLKIYLFEYLIDCLGKGFWVGLVLMATGVLGVLASREGTRSAVLGFSVLATLSTILSFYMMITCIIPLQYDRNRSNATRERWQNNDVILNSLLIAASALGTIIGAIASIVACVHSGCCADQRDSYYFNADANPVVPGTPISMRYPSVQTPQMSFPYQQPTYRMPM